MANISPVGQVGRGGAGYEIERSVVSWRAIFAGLFVSFLCYMILMALGMAVGGAGLASTIGGGTGGSALSVGSAIWIVVSAIISLAIGGYSCARTAGLIAPRVGGVQALVVASLFFIGMLIEVGTTIGFVGGGIGATLGWVGKGAGDLSQNPQIHDTIQASLGQLHLKSPPDQVFQGLATRLLRGDDTGARNYLANQAGITPTDAQNRLNRLSTDFQSTLKSIGQKTARVVSFAGWSMFALLVLGSAACLFGGIFGARVTYRNVTGAAPPVRSRAA